MCSRCRPPTHHIAFVFYCISPKIPPPPSPSWKMIKISRTLSVFSFLFLILEHSRLLLMFCGILVLAWQSSIFHTKLYFPYDAMFIRRGPLYGYQQQHNTATAEDEVKEEQQLVQSQQQQQRNERFAGMLSIILLNLPTSYIFMSRHRPETPTTTAGLA